jgi:uncharacterized protein YjbI with pentapeptide repeats
MRLPTRAEIATLLARYFVGPIADGVAARVEQGLAAIVADPARRQAEDAGFRANSVRNRGQAWKEELAYGHSIPHTIDLVPWLALRDPSAPRARPYCPAALVGVWQRDDRRWQLDDDGRFASDEPDLAERVRWCVERHAAEGHRGDQVLLFDDDDDAEVWQVGEASGAELRLTCIGGATEGATLVLRRPGRRAKTSMEALFAASLEPCPGCGSHDVSTLQLAGMGETWSYGGKCPQCQRVRTFGFATIGDPHARQVGPFDLGPGPSQLVSPAQFLAELVRVGPLIAAAPAALAPPAWQQSVDALTRALICANELRQLLPAGAAAIPGTDDARLRRAWLDGEHARLMALVDAYAADTERNAAVLRGGRPRARGELTTTTLRAHQAWLAAGRQGAGRLDLEGVRAAGVKLGAAELTAASLVGVDLAGAALGFANLDEIELREVDLSRALLDGASLQRSQITGGTFARARLAVSRFEGAVVAGTSFDGADLERSAWQGARVARATFLGVRFGNAAFDGATFAHCDLRGASLAKIQRLPKPSTRGARFEDCDLRDTDWTARDLSGATFVRCQLAGARGKPEAIADLVVEACDVDRDGLLRQLA